MKTAFTTSLKDTIAAATVVTATLITIIGSFVISSDVRAERASQPAKQQVAAQKMDAIVVTAPRFYKMVMLETVVVTASRQAADTTKLVAASNASRS